MKTLKRVKSIQKYLKSERANGQTVGFIPTMGTLHEGHLSLIRQSNEENDITVISIFVNPTQFNEKKDLEKYPRDLAKDQKLLKKVKVDYVFAPSVNQIYPKKQDNKIHLNIDHLIRNMEGPNRPGHFEGVVQVVHRLIEILDPTNIYMGQKDFQQFTIVGYMIDQLKMKTKLRVCPIIRESHGLAMSSRNVRLSKSLTERASIIYENLILAKKQISKRTVEEIESTALKNLSIKDFKPEYFKIVDGYTFEEIQSVKKHKLVVAGTAVWAKNVRLIDNMILKGDNLIQ